MKIKYSGFPLNLKEKNRQLLKKMVSPLCGLTTQVAYASKTSMDPALFTVGVSLTGVHLLLGRPDPGKGGYHIGGMGIYKDEALIKGLAESAERYSQLMADFLIRDRLFCSYSELIAKGETVLPIEFLIPFSSESYERPGFVFQKFSGDSSLSWVQLQRVSDGKKYWIPMQMLFVGYNIQKDRGEPWIMSAVTTGTAVHVTESAAIRNALLELIQIDSAMGHWYTKSNAYRIVLDARTYALERLIEKLAPKNAAEPLFYWLPNADLPGFSIACLLHFSKKIPEVAVGLGSDTSLEDAMYKAYLEAIGVVHLARMIILREKIEPAGNTEDGIFDLDSNVSLYARGGGNHRWTERFLQSKTIAARDIPQDMSGTIEEQTANLLYSFKDKSLFLINLTPPEISELGFVVARAWSPDLLSLCLPSAVPSIHPRFKQYGSCCYDDPHPYP